MANFKLAGVAALVMGLASNLAAAVSFAVPSKVGTGGLKYAPLEPAPVGLSFEFFAFPSYMTNVTATMRCLENWKDLTGTWPPIRIGGTTQDRAQYDASTSAYVVYTVASAADAPASLTFGPRFMDLAATYPGTVVVGLNRGKNNITNTIAAAKVAAGRMGNLLAIELGNEPEYWPGVQPIASGGWSPAIDAASQNEWTIAVGKALGRTDIVQAGNSNSLPPTWGAAELIAGSNATMRDYVKTYAHHNYPGGSIQSLMSHANIATNLHLFDADIEAALDVGKPYVFGETNSVSGGGAAGVSPTFGAALWTMDYSIRATYSNMSRTYYHHGTIGNCQYCFFGRYSMGNPYYGATAATEFMANGKYLTAIDDGTTNYAAYAVYNSAGAPIKVLLYNSDFYSGASTRTSTSFTLTGLTSSSVRAKRLTAASSYSRQDRGEPATFGGQKYTDGTCVVSGTQTFETATVNGGSVTFTIYQSEALLVYL